MKQFAYPSYKSSSVEWIDSFPSHWHGLPLKRCVATRITDGPHETPEFVDEGVEFISAEAVQDDQIDFDRRRGFITRELHEHYIRKCCPVHDDLLMCKSGATTGKLAMVETDKQFSVWSPLALIRADRDQVLPRFLFSALRADYVQEQVQRTWSAGTQPNIAMRAIEKLYVVLPTLAEQQAIAAFLDRETAKIDTLVAKKERLIELLQEKRTALISHAVTKGLNPDAKMKESGVEWVGDIPQHWGCGLLKRVCKRIQTGCTPPTEKQEYYEDGTVAWYGPGSFSTDLVLSKPTKLINADAVRDGVARLFDSDSIVIVTIGATIGKVGYIDAPSSSNQQITAATTDSRRAVGKFVAYQLKRLEPAIRGIAPSATLPIIDQQEVGCLPLALPELDEQRSIVEYLDEECMRIDALAAKVLDGIERLREYRTALISATVTGKIDVRRT